MCLCSEKEGLWVFFFIYLRKERMFFIMFFSGSNIEILNMIHSAEMLRSQSYWVVYSMLTLTSLWHEHINWRHCAQRKKKTKTFLSAQVSDGTVRQKTHEDKVGISKTSFRHNFPDIFHLSRIFEEVLATLLFSCTVFQKMFLGKYLMISKVRG